MHHDAIIVGGGPNGLAAAIRLAQAGWKTLLIEGKPELGGGCRTAALTLPGFAHDVCAAIHPMAASSPFFQRLPLAEHGLRWIHSPAALAHPFDDGTAITIERDLAATAEQFGSDAGAYRRLVEPFSAHWAEFSADLLAPKLKMPAQPFRMAHFGILAGLPAQVLADLWFKDQRSRAAFAGLAAHSAVPLDFMGSAAFGLVMGAAAHAAGWPLAQGGSQAIIAALAACYAELGGETCLGHTVASLDELPRAQSILLDVTPRQLVRMAGARLPRGYTQGLNRFRYGMGVCKLDWALSEPIPWKAAGCARAATVHAGGTQAEIARSEAEAWRGDHPQRPFVFVAQPSLFDPARAPAGKHTAWAYCHVPQGSGRDMTAEIEAQLERFAPGFRDCILARHVRTAAQMPDYNPNYIGGDILGGAQTAWQMLARPVFSPQPYATPVKGLYLCSSSTPPGGGVHGMCGYHAAQSVINAVT